MRRLVALTLLLLFAISATPYAFAQTRSNTNVASPASPLRQAMTERKDAIQAAKEQFKASLQEQRTAFKQKLAQIKDQRKKATVEQIDTHIQNINIRSTTMMSNSLTRLSTILDRAATKASTLNPTGTQDANPPVNEARTKIAIAQEAVASQAAKQYVISITDETNLGQAVRTTLNLLRTDLKATHTLVVDAKMTVVNAIRTLAKTHKDSDKTASPEATTEQ